MSAQVLLIEDDDALRASLTQTLDLEDFQVLGTNSLAQAKRMIRANYPGVVLSDIRMPGDDGFDVLNLVQRVDPDLPVILLTGQADVPMALRAMKSGAFDFLEKPCATEHLITVLERASAQRARVLKARQIEQQLHRNDTAAINFPGSSNAVSELRSNIRKLAGQQVHIHLSGPIGAGKKLAAHTLHSLSSEAFSFHAINAKAGLPQIDPSVPLNLSLKDVEHLGQSDADNLVEILSSSQNLRLITSSTQSLNGLTASPACTTLFAQTNPVSLSVPPLSERRKDLPVLFESLVRQAVRQADGDMPDIPQSVFAEIIAQDWPGNLPQLRSFANSVALGLNIRPKEETELTLAQQMDNFERLVLIETLKRYNGKAVDAARALGLPRKTFYDRLARHDLKPKEFSSSGA